MKFKFHIEESPDAKSFTFYDITGDFDIINNPDGWENYTISSAKLVVREHMTNEIMEFSLTTEASVWAQGIVFNQEDNIFIDGAYEFTVHIDDTWASQRSYGFYAQIKEIIMKESLAYRPERSRVYKELIWEKLRLLDNLFYATETDQIIYFKENLAQLKKLK
jgi:hypothetical protein